MPDYCNDHFVEVDRMPIKLYGGLPPYALHINWQDGNDTLLSVKEYNAALVVTHVYNRSGVYEVLVSDSDASGQKAIFNVALVINGKPSTSIGSILNTPITKNYNFTVYQWLSLLLPPVGYFLGRAKLNRSKGANSRPS